jgi:hypothetical protein
MCSKFVLCQLISLFSNAGQFQSGTIVNVVIEWFRWIIAKICLNRLTPHHCDCWEEAIHRRTDWNFLTCKFRFIIIRALHMVLQYAYFFLLTHKTSRSNSPMSLPFKVKKIAQLSSGSSTRPQPKTFMPLDFRVGSMTPWGSNWCISPSYQHS